MDFESFCAKHKPSEMELFSQFFELFKENFQVRKKKNAIEKLSKIITSTFQLSHDQSFASMSLRELSQHSGVSMGGIYSYIQNKDQLSLYIHQFLDFFCENIFHDVEYAESPGLDPLEQVIRTHVYLSEIMRPWFFFAFMESKNLDKKLRNYAMNSELSVEKKLIFEIVCLYSINRVSR